LKLGRKGGKYFVTRNVPSAGMGSISAVVNASENPHQRQENGML
jgi:hypothetical protein